MRLHARLAFTLLFAPALACAPLEPTDDEAGAADEHLTAPASVACSVPAGPFRFDAPISGPTYGISTVALSMTSKGPVLFTGHEAWPGTRKLLSLARTPDGWDETLIADDTNALANRVGHSIASGPDGCVLYTDGMARFSCGGRTLPGDLGLALAYRDGVRHALFAASKSGLYYVTLDGGEPEKIDTAWTVGATSLAVDAAGTPHVAYDTLEPVAGMPGGTRTIKYARRGAKGWEIETLDRDTWTDSSPNSSVSLALASDGRPNVAYHHRLTRSLRLAERPAGAAAFAKSTLANPERADDDVGRAVALQFDCAGRRHLAYSRLVAPDSDLMGLWYAQIDGGALRAPEALPARPSPALNKMKFYGGAASALAFHIAPDGRQWIALGTTSGPLLLSR